MDSSRMQGKRIISQYLTRYFQPNIRLEREPFFCPTWLSLLLLMTLQCIPNHLLPTLLLLCPLPLTPTTNKIPTLSVFPPKGTCWFYPEAATFPRPPLLLQHKKKFIILRFWRSEVQKRSHWAEVKVPAVFLLGAVGENPLPGLGKAFIFKASHCLT